MKKTYFILLIILPVLFYACRKSFDNDSIPLKTSDFTIQQAKEYLKNESGSLSPARFKLQSADTAHITNTNALVYWKRAKESQLGGFNLVEIPLIISNGVIVTHNITRDGITNQPDLSVAKAAFSRLIIYQDKKTKKIEKEIITYLADKDYLSKNNNDASNNWIDNLSPNFSGYIEYKTWQGKVKRLLRIVNGRCVARYNVTEVIGNPNLQTQAIGKRDIVCGELCEPAYNTNCIIDERGEEQCVTIFSGYYICYNYCYDNGVGGGGGGPEPGDPPSDPNPGTGGGGSTQTVTNNVGGCNGNVIDTLRSKNLSGKIASILDNTFDSSDKVNLTFIESTNTNGAPAASSAVQGAPGTINIEIKVNTSVIPSDASQDYKASLMIHEIIHAYYLYEGINISNQLQQHADIAHNFINDIASMLQQAFGTDTENATALAFGGLKDFATAYPSDYNALLAYYHLTEAKRNSDTEFQRAGLSGKPCN